MYTQNAFAVHFANDSHAFDRSLSPGSESDPVFVKDMIEANNRFAFDLYANLSRARIIPAGTSSSPPTVFLCLCHNVRRRPGNNRG
ncbi:MAG: hypothetical protein METHP_01888 [Methanoregula sp. SKADARSKE-2]|nr:MAG: hypothetical protein METHP_01888 [Methanoregula sp. SKADARSKE-2]